MSCFCACLPFPCKEFLLAAGALLLTKKKDEDLNIVCFIVVLGVFAWCAYCGALLIEIVIVCYVHVSCFCAC